MCFCNDFFVTNPSVLVCEVAAVGEVLRSGEWTAELVAHNLLILLTLAVPMSKQLLLNVIFSEFGFCYLLPLRMVCYVLVVQWFRPDLPNCRLRWRCQLHGHAWVWRVSSLVSLAEHEKWISRSVPLLKISAHTKLKMMWLSAFCPKKVEPFPRSCCRIGSVWSPKGGGDQ